MSDIVNSSEELETGATVNDSQSTDTSTPDTTTPEPQDKSPSLRDAVVKAFDKLSPAPAAKADTEKTSSLPVQEGTEASNPQPAKDIDPISGRVLEPIKAPAGMPPAIREKWGTLDRQVQQYWSDRELNMAQALSKTDNERKLASEFREVAAPYEAMLRQYNTTATQHAKELFNLSHSLYSGTPQQRAHIFHNLIREFQPDPATLQALFAGQQPAQAPQQPQPVNVQAEVEKALAAKAEAEESSRMESALQAFSTNPANEFFDDVRQIMGRAIESGLVQGKTYDELFKNAYDLACQHHPEVKAVLEQRAGAQQTQAAAPAAAAGSAKPVPQVKPSLNGGARSRVPQRSMSVREAAEAAYEKLAGRQ